MPNIAIDNNINITQIRAQWSTDLGFGESSWSFITLRAGGDARALVLTAWEDACMDIFIRERASNWRLDRVLSEDRWPQIYPAIIDDVRLDADPVGGGLGIPPQLTPVISWRSGETGRANRGRTYIGPYTTDAIEDTNVIGPAFNAVQDFADAMIDNFTDVTPGFPMFAIVSRLSDPPLAPFGTYIPVTTYFFFGRWGTQRRRLFNVWRT